MEVLRQKNSHAAKNIDQKIGQECEVDKFREEIYKHFSTGLLCCQLFFGPPEALLPAYIFYPYAT